MQERRKLARSIGLKKATAHAPGSTAVAGSPRRLDTSKLNRYAAVRKKRKPAAVVGEATTASAATTTSNLPSEAGEGNPVAATVAPLGQAAETAPATAVDSVADAALLELAAEVEAAEGSQVEGLNKPKWDVVDVDLGGVIEAAQNAQKERLSSLLSNGPSSQAAAVHGLSAAGRGALTCNGVAMVASPSGADVENQKSPASVVGDDDWEYDYYAVVNPGASSGAGTDLDLGWMGAVEMDATGGADNPDSQTADPVRALPIRSPPTQHCNVDRVDVNLPRHDF